jgi:transcriptional pleiotropic regulator of transition state genes
MIRLHHLLEDPRGTKKRERRRAMKSTGIVRKVDELGRIVLPIEMRRTLDIAERDALEIYVEGSSVILKKYKPSCIFCDATKDITLFKGKSVCPKCMKELSHVNAS